MNNQKLQQKDLAEFRRLLLKKQDGRCSMCNEHIENLRDAVLDHCHATGHCRAVAHRTCNIVEGKIVNALMRSGGNINKIALTIGLSSYYQRDFSSNPIHPKFLTDIDRKIKDHRKKQKMAKTEKTKTKHKEAIKELKANQEKFQLLAFRS